MSRKGQGVVLERRGSAIQRAEVVILVDGNCDDATVGLVVEKASNNLKRWQFNDRRCKLENGRHFYPLDKNKL
jgi:predicted phosphodiesterase